MSMPFFLTPEATESFDGYLDKRQKDGERLTSESPAFRKDYRVASMPAEPMYTGTIRNAIDLTLKDISKTKTGHNYNFQWFTALENISM